MIEKLIDTKGAGHAQKSEGTVTTDSKGVQEYNPVACTGLSCNCDLEECSYVPGCPVWQKSDRGLVRA